MDILLKSYLPRLSVYQLLIGTGMLLMAIEPVKWLVNSWLDPAQDSQGGWVFLLCAGLFVWSIASDMTASPLEDWQSCAQHKKAMMLLVGTACIRAHRYLHKITET
jgi:hypothetical protein